LKLKHLESLLNSLSQKLGNILSSSEVIWDKLEKGINNVEQDGFDANALETELEKLISHLSFQLQTGVSPPPKSLPSLLSTYLNLTLPSHSSSTLFSLSDSSRPSYITRTWPSLIVYPILGVTLGKMAWNRREAFWELVQDGKETVRGFLVGWVIKPVQGILETLRGEEGLRIMGSESLKSDLDVRGPVYSSMFNLLMHDTSRVWKGW
jgi:hypothetical protein